MDKTPLQLAEEYAKGNAEIQTAYEDGFVAGTVFQLNKDIQVAIELNKKADRVWERATGKRHV